MDWNARVELFEQLRQEHEFGVGTIAGVAAKFGVHRRMVRQAIAGALPPPRRYPARIKPKLDIVAAFIDQVLDEDRRARASSVTRRDASIVGSWWSSRVWRSRNRRCATTSGPASARWA